MELATIATIASVAGTAVSAVGTIAAGNAKAAQAEAEAKAQEFRAAQLDMAAKEERASAQRDAFEVERRKNLALSKLTANAASSGFSATDPTSLAIADEISRYGTYQEQMVQYGGEAKARDARLAAAASRYSAEAARQAGRSAKTVGYLSAGGTILSGVGGMASKYWLPSKAAGLAPDGPSMGSKYFSYG